MRRVRFTCLLTLLVGCAQVLGIEEKELPSDGGVGMTASPLACEQYCTDALELCTASIMSEAFESRDICLGICQYFPQGAEPTGNTLACRANKLAEARRFGEVPAACQAAAPGGGSPAIEDSARCGTDCEGYCTLFRSVCSSQIGQAECMRQCAALPAAERYSAKASFLSAADTLQCRIAHLSAAAGYAFGGDEKQKGDHCGHSVIRATGPCELADSRSPSCGDYCKLVMGACTGPSAVYESNDQCMKACEVIARNPGTDKRGNTVRCRREFAYDALTVSPERFCTDSGPAPSQCGARCEAYCQILQTACPSQFMNDFGAGGMGACMTQCARVPANAVYSVGGAVRDTLDCRIKSATRALLDVRACTQASITAAGECSP